MKILGRNNLVLIIAVFIILLCGVVNAQTEISNDNRIGLQVSMGTRNPALNPNTQPWSVASVYCAGLGYGINEEIMLWAEFDLSKIYNDTLSGKIWKIGKDDADRYLKIRNYRLESEIQLPEKFQFYSLSDGRNRILGLVDS